MCPTAGPLGTPSPARLTLVALMLEDTARAWYPRDLQLRLELSKQVVSRFVEALCDSGCGERRAGEHENWFKIALTPQGVKTCRAFLGLNFHRSAASDFARSRDVCFLRALGFGRPMSEASIRVALHSLASLTTLYREGRKQEVIARTEGS